MSAYMDLIFLFIVVGLIFLRLRAVLGTRPEEKVLTSEEVENVYNQIRQQTQKNLNIIEDDPVDEDEELDRTLALIPGFSRSDFCTRCLKVFEMVLQAFAASDENTLKMLTGKSLFNKIKEVIKQRQEEGLSAETDLIRVDELVIEKAEISTKNIAKIVVRFVTEQVNILKNSTGEVIEGDENFVQKITDVWTFEKNINSDSPVWLLTSTKKSNA